MSRQKLSDRTLPDYTKGEEIFNMVSHIVGGAAGITALTLCVIFASIHNNVWGVVSSAIYGASMIILYTMSSIYHGLSPRLKAKKVFQIIDHCSIFLLIAGTYTPFTLCSLRGQNPALGWTIFGVIWAAAALGITLNSIDIKAYRKFSAICYLVMGWCIIIAIKPMYYSLGVGGMTFLATGGICYTIGALIYYLFKKKRYAHSIFHLFVLAGSILHMFSILFYVV
ncbi:MAG: hemolysin III family protein [Clostridia bacterium]|nr:hemolysin III family protein [Clostridia bacterium]